MPVEGRDLSSRRTQHVVRDLEIGQPINSEECSETAEGVARESEGRSRVSLLRHVRQDQPRGHPGSCLCPVPLQQGRTGRGWSGVRGYRGVWGAAMARRTGACVILCRRGKAEEALQQLRQIMGKLKLTVNEEKTRICKVPEGKFDFLGYTFGRMYSARTGKAYLGYRPSRKSIKRMVENVHALTVRAGTWQETTGLVKKLNRTLRGWANYFE